MVRVPLLLRRERAAGQASRRKLVTDLGGNASAMRGGSARVAAERGMFVVAMPAVLDGARRLSGESHALTVFESPATVICTTSRTRSALVSTRATYGIDAAIASSTTSQFSRE